MTHQSRKNLSAYGLFSRVKIIVKKLPNQIKGPNTSKKTITLTDNIMSAIAIFSLKYTSLLSFNIAHKERSAVRNNLKSLFFVNNPPSDSTMRERLDEVDPKALRKLFTRIFSQAQRDKALESYRYLNDYYIISLDGTCYFSSKSVYCNSCCTKKHRDGSTTYYHNVLGAAVVNPSMNTVIPLAPEPILKEDGNTKNGSEQKAATRFIENLKNEHPHLKVIITADSLHSKGPFIKQLNKAGYKFIMNAKQGDHKSLFEFVEGKGVCTNYIVKIKGITYEYRYVNNVPLNDANKNTSINFLECIETKPARKKTSEKKTTYTWVTNIKITKDNIHQLMQGGRTRWKIENETFNALKNMGYQFEHNFGHGKKNLSVIFMMLAMLAFLIDQVQEQSDALFQAALKKEGGKKYLWEQLRTHFLTFLIDSWKERPTLLLRSHLGKQCSSAKILFCY